MHGKSVLWRKNNKKTNKSFFSRVMYFGCVNSYFMIFIFSTYKSVNGHQNNINLLIQLTDLTYFQSIKL